jgi:drug/metabolite transporter (DMT)-like permease
MPTLFHTENCMSRPAATFPASAFAGDAAAQAMLLLVAAIWGGSYVAAKVATQQLPVLEFLMLRFGLTFVVLLPALRPLLHQADWRAVGSAAGLGGVLLAIFTAETFGVAQTTAAKAAFLISLCVVFTPVCEWVLLGQRPAAAVWGAATVCCVGAGLLAFQHGGGAALAWGDALMVLAALLRGVMVCLTRRHGQRHPMPALTLTAVQMGVMTLGALVLLVVKQGWVFHPLPVQPAFWGGMAYLVLLCTVFAFFAQNHAAVRTPPSQVALLMGSEPLFGALLAVGWLGESLTAQGWLGGVLMVVASWWVTRPTRAHTRLSALPAQ